MNKFYKSLPMTKSIMLKSKSLLIAIMIGISFHGVAFASPITINFTGLVSSIGTDLQGDSVTIGDTINGQFTYETVGNTDSALWSDDYGKYQVSSFEVSFGSSFHVSSNGVRDTLNTQDDMQKVLLQNQQMVYTCYQEETIKEILQVIC